MIGLTGGIGSGKSTVGRFLRDLGATVVDADEAAHAVVEPGQPALAEIREAFGDDVLHADGALNRQALADHVFADPEARARLEAITHPRVREWMAAHVADAAERGAEVVFMDVPLLFETGMDQGMAETVVVWTPVEEQVRRAVARGMAEDDVRARVAAQVSLDEKRARATHVVDNSGTVEATREQVRELWERLRGEVSPLTPT